MKIQAILQEEELQKAILEYVVKAGYPVTGMDTQIELTKGRGANGTYATIDFIPAGTSGTDNGSLGTLTPRTAELTAVTTGEVEDCPTESEEVVEEDAPPFEEETAVEEEDSPAPTASLFS